MTSVSQCVSLTFILALLSSAPILTSAATAFKHPQGLFTVEVPDGWSVHSGGLVFRFQKLDFLVKIIVQATPDHSAIGKIWTGQALEGLRDVRKLPGSDLRWGGAESGRYDIYSGSGPGGESMKIEIVSATDGVNSYIMVLSAPRQTWEDLNREWRNFVYEFHLCRVPAAQCTPQSQPARRATPAPAPAPAPPPAGSGGSLFGDPKQRFHLRVPAGWTATATQEGAVLSRASAYVNVLVFDGRRPPRSLVEALSSQVSGQWRNFQEMQGGETSLAGLAADFSLSAGVNPKGVPAVLKVVAAADTQRSYTLLASVSRADFESLRGDLDMIESSITTGAPAARQPAPASREQTPAPQPAAPVPLMPPAIPSAPPSSTLKAFLCAGFSLSLPDNWKRHTVSGNSLLYFTTGDGLHTRAGGVSVLTGLIAGFSPMGASDLRGATDALVQRILAENPGARLSAAPREQTAVAGLPAESLLLEGQSLLTGEPEVTWLITVRRPQGLFHLMLVSPRSDFSNLRTLFGRIATSVRFP
ncbi:MAG: hypothetical protein HY820_16350 [Acidobacteria bacterium]|nr:hypothetical protein [Acidobacteriota bacterium]